MPDGISSKDVPNILFIFCLKQIVDQIMYSYSAK